MIFVGFLILFGLSVLFSCEGQVYPPSNKSITVLSGSTARLKWSSTANPSVASLFWYFTRRGGSIQEQLALKVQTFPAVISNSSLPGVGIETSTTLVLKNVDERYNGKYELNVQAAAGGGDAEVDLYIAEKPTVTFTCSSRILLNEGDNFTCVCRGEGGNPPADVTWFKDGVQIGETGKEEQTLTLSNVLKTASGIYKCVTQSYTLTHEKSVEIIVYYTVPPTVVTLTSTPGNVVFGESVVIICEAIAVPLPSYIIIHNDTVIVSTQNAYIITVLKHIHAGSYKCIATNHLGNSSKIFSLSVAATRSKNAQTTLNFGTDKAGLEESNCSGTEWYIVVVSLVSGIIIGILLSYIVWCSHRRWFRNRKPGQNPEPQTNEVDTTYQELDLSKMNKEDNYQSLRVNAASNDDDATYTELKKTSDVEDNYQSLT